MELICQRMRMHQTDPLVQEHGLQCLADIAQARGKRRARAAMSKNTLRKHSEVATSS